MLCQYKYFIKLLENKHVNIIINYLFKEIYLWVGFFKSKFTYLY